MSGLTDWLLHLDPVWIYVAVASLVFLEDAIFVGFAVPGETAAVIAGVAASFDHIDVRLAVVIVVTAAILGDSVGYQVGRSFFGPKVLDSDLMRKHHGRIEKAHGLLRRRGGIAVFLGRWTAFFRAMMPALAGAAHMPYRKFLVWNALGGIAWGTTFVLLGNAAGTSYHVLEKQAGRWSAVALAVIVVLVLTIWHFTREREPQ
jgi:membrane protein DedA with SNARE-associated domain